MTVDKTIEKKREINDAKNDPDLDKEITVDINPISLQLSIKPLCELDK
jgi:hypothetical protein